MRFAVNVSIRHHDNKDLTEFYCLDCMYSRNPNTYGNGYYLIISDINKNGIRQLIDLRYDTDFSIDEAISYICIWCDRYWNGKNGAYKLEHFSIINVTEDIPDE